MPISEMMRQCLLKGILASQYFTDNLQRQDFDIAVVIAALETAEPIESLLSIQRQIALLDIADRDEFDRQLRRLRRLAQSLIIVRDVSRIASTGETCRDVSLAADYFIETAREWHFKALCDRHGVPTDSSGKMVEFAILAMGKLGGYELNLSSDVDLVFAYREGGVTSGDRPLEHQVFFTRLGQRLIQSLDALTSDGYVYRVDMRLRPYGQSGALVCSFDSLESYLQTQGRAWERYAMAKARVVSRCGSDIRSLDALIGSFSFRKYIDFSVIDSLREIKELIKSENKRLNRSNNVKLGVGGIREAEFIVQSFQVVHGGRDPLLQEAGFITTLPRLIERELISREDGTRLQTAYLFLRDVEHLIQAWHDEQSQTLPGDEEGMARIAFFMDCNDIDEFPSVMTEHRNFVGELFTRTISERESSEYRELVLDPKWLAMWQGDTYPNDAFGDSAQQLIAELKDGRVYQALSEDVQQRLDKLIPRLFAACAAAASPELALTRTWPIILAVLRRATYMSLLLENPQSLGECVHLCHASPFIAEEISKHPALLNELLNAQKLYLPPSIDMLRSELRQALMRLNWDDLEGHMEILRYFRRAHMLRVAACEVTQRLELMKVSDYLSWLAEVILEQVVAIAWVQMTHRYGSPVHEGDELLVGDRFSVIAYGKLGGIELNYSSDLDVVFVHDTDPMGQTNGERSIDNQTFFARLGQRIMHVLTAEMASGRLYEIDTRLRPSGNSGPLVSSFKAFEKYQSNSAWVWEHQALTRARPVACDRELAQKIQALRLHILSMPNPIKKIREEVIKMRQKMYDHLSAKSSELFDLKHDRGGMIDLEFIVQFMLLAHTQQEPMLAKWTDNIRIIDALISHSFLSKEEGRALQDAYRTLRGRTHELALQQQKVVIPGDQLTEQRKMVSGIWLNKVEIE